MISPVAVLPQSHRHQWERERERFETINKLWTSNWSDQAASRMLEVKRQWWWLLVAKQCQMGIWKGCWVIAQLSGINKSFLAIIHPSATAQGAGNKTFLFEWLLELKVRDKFSYYLLVSLVEYVIQKSESWNNSILNGLLCATHRREWICPLLILINNISISWFISNNLW